MVYLVRPIDGFGAKEVAIGNGIYWRRVPCCLKDSADNSTRRISATERYRNIRSRRKSPATSCWRHDRRNLQQLAEVPSAGSLLRPSDDHCIHDHELGCREVSGSRGTMSQEFDRADI